MRIGFLSPKSFIKSHPRVFDLTVRLVKRGVLGRRGPIYDILDQFSRSRGGRVSFVQIGANDGLRNDPIREFVARDDWRGVLIEPLPAVFEMLRRNYDYLNGSGKLAFENAAISGSDASLSFFTVAHTLLRRLSLDAQLELLRKSSFSREHMEQFVDDPADVVRVDVPCTTVGAIIQRHFPENTIDLLVIDAEGHEAVILKSLDFAQSRIGAVLFESHHLEGEGKDVFRLLEGHGYTVHKAGGDAFAILEK